MSLCDCTPCAIERLPIEDDETLHAIARFSPKPEIRTAARDLLSERRWLAARYTPPEGGCPHVP